MPLLIRWPGIVKPGGDSRELLSNEDIAPTLLAAAGLSPGERMSGVSFLPLLKASDDARIVNISSVFGIIAPPGQTAYCASKFAVRGFSEALRKELQGTSVGVSVVHPGGVATSIARSARRSHFVPEAELAAAVASIEAKLKMPPAEAGETIVKGIEQRKPRILVGNDAKFLAMIERFAPVSYWRLLQRMA